MPESLIQIIQKSIRKLQKGFRRQSNSSFNLINQVIPIMKKNNSGSIINITSINAHQGFPDNPSYISSKGGLSSLTQSLALDLGKI